MTTLYRKYRPQTFANIIGQEHIIQTLTNEIADNKIAHAYLFSGPRGVGKTTTARLIAKAINCQNRKEGKFEPCEECRSCREITDGRHIDVIEIDAASQTGVENVRENIIENAQFKPVQSKYKVFIIDEVHMLSNSAFNALLKTLEEPPSHIIFVLATTELHKLPETVISRCQRFNFKKIKFEEMAKRLEQIAKEEEVKIEKDVFSRVINKSDGCMRDAESLLGQIIALGKKKITNEDVKMVLPTSDIEAVIKFLINLSEKKSGEAIDLLNSLSENGTNLDEFAHDLLEITRLMMILQAGVTHRAGTEYSQENNKKIKELSSQFSEAEIILLIESILERRMQIKTSPLPQLPLELLVVNFCSQGQTFVPPTKILETDTKKDEEKINKKAESVPLKNTERKIEMTSKSIKTTLEQIKNKWEEIITELSETNHSLVFILKMCQLVSMRNGALCLAVPFAFHRDKLAEPKNKKIIEDKLADKFFEKIPLYCEVVVAQEADQSSNADLANIASQFGGEII